MAKIHGVAGEWARVQGMVAGLLALFLGIFACGFSVAACLFVSAAIGLLLLALSLIGMAWSLARGLRHVERYFKGARGEERVAGILKSLPDAYHVFNDFVARRTHVDHVVVGPAGVFAVETKFWRGRVTVEEGHVLVDGRLPSREPLVQARHEAGRVGQELEKLGWKGQVTPVLAFASDTFEPRSAEVGGAVVMNACELSAAFATKSVVIPPDELDRIVTLMENNQR